jgi:beta-fructofuranosidase
VTITETTRAVREFAEAARALRAALAADPHRPRYHFLSPSNWLNDPNGLIQWRGQYHLFYQYNPNGTFSATKHWGHAVSPDLVHWSDLPIALAPLPGTADEDGCYSGCAVVDRGVPTLVYTGVRARQQRPCIAISRDDDLIAWQRYSGNPVISDPPHGLELVGFRDHAAWREGDMWYQIVGSGMRDHGGAALLFRSADLRAWEYLHPLYVGDKNRLAPIWTGIMWECPDFFPLGDQHVLIVSVFDHQRLSEFAHLPMIHHAVYFTGIYIDHRLIPTREGMVDYGYSLYAPQSFTDDRGRRILFGWLREERSGEAQLAAGWSGAMSLPRVLNLGSDGRLDMAPAPEVERLRERHQRWERLALRPEEPTALAGARGDAIELIAELSLDAAAEVGICVRCAPDDVEATRILYDRATQRLIVDRTRSSLDPTARRDICGAPFELADGQPLRLRVFVDRSIVEVFAGHGICMSSRVYPTRPDSLDVKLFARGGGAQLISLDLWEMGAIWP